VPVRPIDRAPPTPLRSSAYEGYKRNVVKRTARAVPFDGEVPAVPRAPPAGTARTYVRAITAGRGRQVACFVPCPVALSNNPGAPVALTIGPPGHVPSSSQCMAVSRPARAVRRQGSPSTVWSGRPGRHQFVGACMHTTPHRAAVSF
jgi:hypothetical protein